MSTPSATAQVVWARRRRPVAVHEVTARMRILVQRAADASMLPQTVWPSVYYGADFVGEDCLLVSAAAVLDTVPAHAAPGSDPLFTVIPSRYFGYVGTYEPGAGGAA